MFNVVLPDPTGISPIKRGLSNISTDQPFCCLSGIIE